MPFDTIAPGSDLKLDGVQNVKLTHDGPKPADVEITGDGTHINRRIEPDEEITEQLFGNPVTITNKSKYDVTATW